jgi:hypothetical protein
MASGPLCPVPLEPADSLLAAWWDMTREDLGSEILIAFCFCQEILLLSGRIIHLEIWNHTGFWERM